MVFLRYRRCIARLHIIFLVVYVIVTLPFSVVELEKRGNAHHVVAWFVGGILVMAANTISFLGILRHFVNFTKPDVQIYIFGILLMVPIYGMTSWLALRFQIIAIYLDTIRDCYKAFVIYAFMKYLLSNLPINEKTGGISTTTSSKCEQSSSSHGNEVQHQVDQEVESKEDQSENSERRLVVSIPREEDAAQYSKTRLSPRYGPFIESCIRGTKQFTYIKLATTFIALVCELTGTYHEGNFDFESAWSYLTIIDTISQFTALYYMRRFRKKYKKELNPIQPTMKFWCIYFVIFLSFWQSILISILAKVNVIPHGGTWGFNYSIEQVATGLQDFLILVEMFVASIIHNFAFPHEPFESIATRNASWCTLMQMMWELPDINKGETEKRQGNEETPLAEGNSPSTSREYTGMRESQSASHHSRVTETTPSVNNYMELVNEEDDHEVGRTAHIS